MEILAIFGMSGALAALELVVFPWGVSLILVSFLSPGAFPGGIPPVGFPGGFPQSQWVYLIMKGLSDHGGFI